MITGQESQLLQIAGDQKQEPRKRIAALDELGRAGGKDTVNELKKLFTRVRPGPESVAINWDPIAMERVIDLHIIRALHNLGDNSEIHRIRMVVAQAGNILAGPDDEISNAALVILAIGHIEPVQHLIELAASEDPKVVTNAVKTLGRLNLPQPPAGGAVPNNPGLRRPLSFEIHTLKEEMETLEKMSQGSIRLSSGVREFIESRNYERGRVIRKGTTLADIVQKDLPIIGFEYFTEGSAITICTYTESGQRWQDWWRRYGKVLRYENGRFMLLLT